MLGMVGVAVGSTLSGGVLGAEGWFDPREPIPLRVWIENAGDAAITVDAHTDPGCFATTWLELQFDPTAKPLARARCEPFDVTLAPGEQVERIVDLRTVAVFGVGTHSWRSTWRPPAGASFTSWSGGQGTFHVAEPVHTGRMTVGVPVSLPDGSELLLRGHSHKSMSGAGRSPLIVEVDATDPSGRVSSVARSVQVEERPIFEVAGWNVRVGQYAYQEWMDVRVFGPAPTRAR